MENIFNNDDISPLFFSIMEHTENIINPNKGLIPSLLKVFYMFKLSLFYDKNMRKNILWVLYLSIVEIVIKTQVHI